VPNFFCTHAPVERVSWKIYAHEKGIRVEPQYLFFPSYENKKIIFFEEYIYVPHEGFTRIRGIPPYLERHLEEKVVDDKEALFVLEHLAEWKPWIDFVDPKLRAPREMTLEASKATCEENNEWNVDLFKISVYELWQAIEQGQKRIFSEAGVIDLTDSRFQWLSSFNKRRWKGKTKTLELGAVEWARVQAFEGLSMFSSEEQKQLPPFSLQGLQSTLRPYQQSGLHWLWFLYHNGLSGVLCDEMGLGKTHQAMALLAAVHNDSSLKKQKYLVVCPTSVLYHWQELLHKYLPGLKVCLFYGYARQAIKLEADYDVILTSYGTVRSEKKHLQTIPFTLAIYDELQQAKNPKSQIHRALCSFQVKMAVGLTGTPIENRIGDIKALFDLVLPGYFVSPASFQENFINPIEKEKNPEAMQRLARMVKPFVLRRKKKDVLLELPEKEEEIAYCDLSDLQLQMYREAFFSSQKEIRKEMELVDKSRAEMHIFALFSKLKQICDHPCLILGKIDQYTNFASGKWDLFVELLSEARESGQKVVVFTQYLQMLDILGKYLTSEGIEYAEIRGSTRNRGDQIRRFQQEPECEVFLGSLQAAGVGIELTAASVVIHYDRWWNPAKENQATDRVHRIGQSRGVQVFKLVTKKTIEERIHRLIEEKKGLLEQVVGFDDQDIVKRFTKQELLTLLTDLEKDLSP
jgi:SNF2 family DNA or RNA helicase